MTLLLAACVLIPVYAGADKVDIRLNLKDDQSWEYRFVQAETVTIHFPQHTTMLHGTTKLGVVFDVIKANGDGTVELKASYSSPSLSFRISGEQAPEELMQPINELLSRLDGHSFTFTLTRHGRAVDLDGLDDAVTNAAKTMPAADQASVRVAAAVVEAYLGKAAVAPLMDSIFSIYPRGPVEIGERWRRQSAVNVGISLVQETFMKILRTGGGMTDVKVYSVMETPDQGGALLLPGAPGDTRCTMKGTSQGEMQIEQATGLIQSASLKNSLQGSTSSGEGASKVTTPIALEGTLTIQRD